MTCLIMLDKQIYDGSVSYKLENTGDIYGELLGSPIDSLVLRLY